MAKDIMEAPLLAGRTAEISLFADHFVRIARLVHDTGRPIFVTAVCRGGDEATPQVRLDRNTLYVRWNGEKVEAFWIKTESQPTLLWPSLEAFNGDGSINPDSCRTIKALRVPWDLV